MWLLMTSVKHDLTAGPWIRRISCTVLVVLSLFSLGLLGGFLIQTIQVKWINSNPPPSRSGSAFAPSTMRSYGSNLTWSKIDATPTTRKSASAHWNIGATGGR